MRIDSVAAHALSSPIDPPQIRQFYGGERTLHKRDFVLVIVETADGQRGVAPAGASSSAMREHFEGASQRTFAERVSGPVAEAVEGTEIDEPADCHDLVAGADLPERVASEAASAIDVALYDLLGRERGVPVHELLAERENREPDAPERLPLYASAGMYMEPAGYAAQAGTIADLGFEGYKYRPGIGPDGDVETAELLGEVDTGIMADAHTWWKLGGSAGANAYTAAERNRIVEAYEAIDAVWLEEPVAPDDYAGYRELAAETSVPLAGGESEPDADGLEELLDTGAVAYLQGDVRHHGGFTGCQRAVAACRGTDTTFVPHNFGTALGTVANAHLVAAMSPEDGEPLLEYPVFEDDPALDVGDAEDPGMYPFDLAFDLIEGTLGVDDGRLAVPDEPGLGVTVDPDVVERYPFIEGAWTTFDYDE